MPIAIRLRAAWLAANGQEKVPGKNTGRKPVLTPEQEAEMKALGYLCTPDGHRIMFGQEL